MTVEQAERALKVGEGVTKGDLYQHFKGEIYEVLGVAIHTETREELIVYRSLETDKMWMRPKKMFFGKTDTGVPRFAKVGENGKLTTNDAWLERVVLSMSDASLELQSCKCPYCKKYLTTPYMYYFTSYPYCPSCGKKVGKDGGNQSK